MESALSPSLKLVFVCTARAKLVEGGIIEWQHWRRAALAEISVVHTCSRFFNSTVAKNFTCCSLESLNKFPANCCDHGTQAAISGTEATLI